MEGKMDDQFNRQTNTDPYRQTDNYQQGNDYQQENPYQQGNPYQQQGNPYQQSNPYQQGNPYQQSNPYQQGNPYMANGGGYYGANPEPEKAPNIFQQFALAFVPTKYSRLTKVKTGSMIGFVTLLVLIATVFSFISLVFEISSVDMEEVAAQLPDFTIKNGRLHMDEDFLLDESDVFIYMTEDIEGFSYDDADELFDEGYRKIMLIGRDRLSIMQNTEYQQFDYSQLGNLEISRTWIVTKLIPLILIIVAIAYIFVFVGKALWYFLCAAVYLLIAMLISSVMRKGQEAGALFRTAVYAKVLMFVIATAVDLLMIKNVSIPFYLRGAVTVAFMGVAIAKLPNDQTPASMQMGQGWR